VGDMGDMFRERREWSKQKRAQNRQNSVELLTEKNIPFKSSNGNVHIVVAERYDFWPGTGLWSDRRDKESKATNRGVFRLIKRVQDDAATEETLRNSTVHR
jgi:hypothetical protein